METIKIPDGRTVLLTADTRVAGVVPFEGYDDLQALYLALGERLGEGQDKSPGEEMAPEGPPSMDADSAYLCGQLIGGHLALDGVREIVNGGHVAAIERKLGRRAEILDIVDAARRLFVVEFVEALR